MNRPEFQDTRELNFAGTNASMIIIIKLGIELLARPKNDPERAD
jgi:hypothetical protein